MLRRRFLRQSVLLSAAMVRMPARPIVSQPTDEYQELFLQEAEIRHTWPIGVGITGTRRARLTDGKLTHDAHIQFVNEFHSSSGGEINVRDSYRHNIAAFHVDRLLGVGMVPVCVEREWENRPAAFSWWVDDILITERQRIEQGLQPPDARSWNKQMLVVRIFDEVIGNTDRNLSNLVITKDWRVWMIDHSRAFTDARQLPHYNEIRLCERGLFERLKDLSSTSLDREVEYLLEPSQRSALLARRDRIIQVLEQRIREKGEQAVLYDYLPR